MAVSPEYRDYLEDLFASVGGVTQRRMFGGLGIFRDGVMIALVDDEVLYFKADDETVPRFEAEGSEPFVYQSRGKPVSLSYWRAPAFLFEDADAFRDWALAAHAAALRAKKDQKPGSGRGVAPSSKTE